MPQLRVLHPITHAGTDARDDDLREYAGWARAQAGCLESEPYRRSSGGHALLVELWADEAAFSAHWRDVLAGAESADVLRDAVTAAGAPPSEIYLHRTFHKERGWVDDTLPEGGSVIAWPGRGGVRVLIISSVAEPAVALTGFAADEAATRRESGCLEYDWCQSLEDPHHVVLAELWQSQPIYDAHWQLRIKVAEGREARGEVAPRRTPGPRSLGSNGAEFYRHAPFTHHYDRWLPTEVTAWSETVSWAE